MSPHFPMAGLCTQAILYIAKQPEEITQRVPATAFVPVAALKDWKKVLREIAFQLFLGMVCFSLLRWKDSATLSEKCLFTVIAGTLCVISSGCFAMYSIARVHDPAMGKRGDTFVLLKR